MLDSEFFDQFDPDQVRSELKNWERLLEDQYGGLGVDKHFEKVTKRELNVQRMLQGLPKADRERFMREYERIIGMTKLNEMYSGDLAQGVIPRELGRKLSTPKRGRAPVSVTVDPNLVGSHPLATIWNALTGQLDASEGVLKASSNIVRSEWMEQNALAQPMEVGKKVLVFDTETAGLTEDSGIRQISWGVTDVKADGTLGLGMDDVEDVHFRTHQMPRGFIATDGVNTMNIEAAIGEKLAAKGKGFANEVPAAGDDFAEALRPFLEQMRDVDYVLGQNVPFDLNQVLRGLRLTSPYLNNTNGFAELLDEATETISANKIRDTLHMAKGAIPNLGIAQELQSANKLSAYSIENLMLETDLFDYIMHRHGNDEAAVTKLLGLGESSLHSADVDTVVTSYLHDALVSDDWDLRAVTMPSGGIYGKMRAAVIKSYGMTPITKITDASHIDRTIFERMLNEDGAITLNNSPIDADTGRVIDIDFLRGMSVDDAYQRMLKDDVAAKFDITPGEQRMILTRQNLTSATEEFDSWRSVFSFGKFRRYSGMNRAGEGFLNQDQSLFKRGVRSVTGDFSDLQQRLAKAGMPFAGISEDERWFTHAISLAAQDMTDMGSFLKGQKTEKAMIGITDDLGISRFKAYENSWISKSGKTLSMDPRLIQKAEEAGVLTRNFTDDSVLTMLDFSLFEHPGGKGFNIRYKMEKDQADKLAEYIDLNRDELSGFFKNPDDIDRFVADLPEYATDRGIGIASLEGPAGERAYEIGKQFNIGQTSDDAIIHMQAGLMGAVGEDNTLRTGAFIVPKYGDKDFMARYAKDMDLARRRHDNIKALGKDHGWIFDTMSSLKSAKESEVVEKALRGYDVVRPAAPYVVAATAVAGIGYYLFGKHREKEQYRPTMDEMDYESRHYAPLDDVQQQQIYSMRRGVDPLRTAGVVNSEYNRRIGHTNMGPNKNAHLYGG